MESSHLPWIDWLRFLATFLVLLLHVRGAVLVEYNALPPEQKNLFVAVVFIMSRMGREAVLLFFVLSGFLVGGRLLERVVQGSFRAKDYALDRATRIYIPLVPALMLSGGVAHFTHAPADAGLFCMNLAGLQDVWCKIFGANDPLWTLSFEIWFYALGGTLAWIVQTRRLSLLAGVILIIALAVFSKVGGSFLFCWLLGALAWCTRPKKFSPFACGVGVLLIAVGTGATQVNRETSLDLMSAGFRQWIPDQTMVRLVLASGFGLTIQNLAVWMPSSGLLTRVERMGAMFASCSYTLYLTHYPVLLFLAHLGLKRADRISLEATGCFMGELACCLAVALLFWFFFESRTPVVRRWLRERWVG